MFAESEELEDTPITPPTGNRYITTGNLFGTFVKKFAVCENVSFLPFLAFFIFLSLSLSLQQPERSLSFKFLTENRKI